MDNFIFWSSAINKYLSLKRTLLSTKTGLWSPQRGQGPDELGSAGFRVRWHVLGIGSNARCWWYSVDSDKKMWVQWAQQWGQLQKSSEDWAIFLLSLTRRLCFCRIIIDLSLLTSDKIYFLLFYWIIILNVQKNIYKIHLKYGVYSCTEIQCPENGALPLALQGGPVGSPLSTLLSLPPRAKHGPGCFIVALHSFINLFPSHILFSAACSRNFTHVEPHFVCPCNFHSASGSQALPMQSMRL